MNKFGSVVLYLPDEPDPRPIAHLFEVPRDDVDLVKALLGFFREHVASEADAPEQYLDVMFNRGIREASVRWGDALMLVTW